MDTSKNIKSELTNQDIVVFTKSTLHPEMLYAIEFPPLDSLKYYTYESDELKMSDIVATLLKDTIIQDEYLIKACMLSLNKCNILNDLFDTCDNKIYTNNSFTILISKIYKILGYYQNDVDDIPDIKSTTDLSSVLNKITRTRGINLDLCMLQSTCYISDVLSTLSFSMRTIENKFYSKSTIVASFIYKDNTFKIFKNIDKYVNSCELIINNNVAFISYDITDDVRTGTANMGPLSIDCKRNTSIKIFDSIR